MKVNLNHQVTVTLTMTGAATYNDYMGQFPRKHRLRAEPGQALTMPLWEVMEVFGSCVGTPGTEVPFVGNALELPIAGVEPAQESKGMPQ